jgi:O-methyltransferase
MAKALLKKIFKLGGVDLKRYDQSEEKYSQLYDRYKKFTMIPRELFMLNLDLCNAFKKTDGDYVECGVWRGGMSAAIAEILGKKKMVHLYDSFEGLPPAQDIDGEDAIAWQKDTNSPGYFDNCAAEEKFAIDAMAMAKHNLYETHRGWFDKTLPIRNKQPIAILRLDGDWYESIMTCLDHLYPDVVEGGLIILDDYYAWDGCARAVHDYLSKTKSPARIFQWHNRVAYILKKS